MCGLILYLGNIILGGLIGSHAFYYEGGVLKDFVDIKKTRVCSVFWPLTVNIKRMVFLFSTKKGHVISTKFCNQTWGENKEKYFRKTCGQALVKNQLHLVKDVRYLGWNMVIHFRAEGSTSATKLLPGVGVLFERDQTLKRPSNTRAGWSTQDGHHLTLSQSLKVHGDGTSWKFNHLWTMAQPAWKQISSTFYRLKNIPQKCIRNSKTIFWIREKYFQATVYFK